MTNSDKVAVVIPTFKAADTILEVISNIPPVVDAIIVVDDQCPQKSGDLVEKSCSDERVVVLRHEENQGVGGAVATGYQAAFDRGMAIAVKIDSDGQMDPALLPQLVKPLLSGMADYVKGNRFYNPEDVRAMPIQRLIGNLGLSFLTKFSTGYWNIFDPTNGFTALHRTAYHQLPINKVSKRFFFETDLLFRLHVARAVVADMPMKAKYDGEHSSLSLTTSFIEFTWRHVLTFFKRVAYEYFIRDFSPGSLNLTVGAPLFVIAIFFGVWNWAVSISSNVPATAGTVVLSALMFVVSFQLLQSFLNQDYNSVPRIPLQRLMGHEKPFHQNDAH